MVEALLFKAVSEPVFSIRVVIIEDEPLATQYLAELPGKDGVGEATGHASTT